MTASPRKPAITRRQFLQTAGAIGVAGLAGALWGYNTACSPLPAPALRRGPGVTALGDLNAPILLVTNPQALNPFGPYLGEILRAEGITLFRLTTVDALADEDLARRALVILAEGPLTSAHADQLRDFVTGGGALLALRPDDKLAALLGVRMAGEGAEGGWLRVTAHPAGAGIHSDGLRFYGPALALSLDGAESIAVREGDDVPLIAWHAAGEGLASVWAFDLARSVALTRQGNPQWANQDRDGLEGVRAVDMFVGRMDLERLAVPHADELQRLFVNVVQALSARRGPLPRLWYFPAPAEAVVVVTGDSHQNIAPNIEHVLQLAERHDAQMSIYYSPPPLTCERRILRNARSLATRLPLANRLINEGYPLPRAENVAAWRERGHEFTMHPFVEAGVAQGYNDSYNQFIKFGYGPISATTRTHRILWQGWAETARVQVDYDIRLNLDYYHVGPSFLGADGRSAFGHFTGSGLPMKFVDERGVILNVYQQNTPLVDEHLLDALGGAARLSPAAAVSVSRQMIEAARTHWPAALGTQFHVDPYELGGAGAAAANQWLEGTLAYAAQQRVPGITAARWLAFVEARHDAEVSAFQWNAGDARLSFEFSSADSGFESELLIPLRHGAAELRGLHVNDRDLAVTEAVRRAVGGTVYAAVRLPSGRHTLTAQYGA